jgi:hypothetical protein
MIAKISQVHQPLQIGQTEGVQLDPARILVFDAQGQALPA